jgi:hypothetical protein
MQNTGAQFWKDDASALPYYPRTRLMATWPVNRGSTFADSSWSSPSRPVSVFTKVFESDATTLAADQHTVWPGQIARFQFTLTYPSYGMSGGSYIENFELVQDGRPDFWVTGSNVWQRVNVPDQFQASFSSVSGIGNITHASKGSLSFSFRNSGARFWKDDASALPYYPRTRLVGDWPVNRVSSFYDPSSWLSPNRPVSVFTHVYEANGTTLAADQHTVWPGQIAQFQFPLGYPTDGTPVGRYREHFSLVQDGIPNFWVAGSDAWQDVSVND